MSIIPKTLAMSIHYVVDSADEDSAFEAIGVVANKSDLASSGVAEEVNITCCISVKNCTDLDVWLNRIQKQSRGSVKNYLKAARKSDSIRFSSNSVIDGVTENVPCVILYS